MSKFYFNLLDGIDWNILIKDRGPEFVGVLLIGLFIWKIAWPFMERSIARSDAARDQAMKELEATRIQAIRDLETTKVQATKDIDSARRDTLTEVLRALETQEARTSRSLDARDKVNERSAQILGELHREITRIGEKIK